jgi:hypothetical protein
MKAYSLKKSALCLVSILSFMSYESAAHGDASLMVEPKDIDKDLALTAVIFKPDYPVDLQGHYGDQLYIIPGTYPEIKISATFRNEPVEDIVCSPQNVTIPEGGYLYITVTSYKNRPDQGMCSLKVTTTP